MPIKELVTWQNSYSVNVPLIDSQHKELVNLTNRLYASCMKGREASKQVFMTVLRAAVDYVGFHFTTEEKIMERVAYPGFPAHKKEHSDFVKKVLIEVGTLNQKTNYNPLSFVYFLKDWVLTHIAVTDTLMGKYLTDLKKKGDLQKITVKVKKVNVVSEDQEAGQTHVSKRLVIE